MLDTEDYATMARLLRAGADKAEVDAAANQIRARLTPIPQAS
nr:hypothetical protein [Pseudenhygromyxa sp. WMMC2535]